MYEDNFFVYEPIEYDPLADIAPVDQFGFVDLHEAFLNASIPGELNTEAENYNGVDDPDSLLGRPSDVFDAIRKASYVQSSTAASTEGDAATSNGASE